VMAGRVLWAPAITQLVFPADPYNPQAPPNYYQSSFDAIEDAVGYVGWVIYHPDGTFKVPVDVYITHPNTGNVFQRQARILADKPLQGVASYTNHGGDSNYDNSRLSYMIPHKFRDGQPGTIAYQVANRPALDVLVGSGGKTFQLSQY
jgi:hypothetical protein